MSERENFLSRWSRRKREAEAAPKAEAQVEQVTSSASAHAPAPAEPAAEEAAFDLSSLPSLDQIAADTDISAFMKPGVPAALRHAALRRAWASDPAIRDFRGLQENDWDFSAPDGVPGFGTFKADEEIRAIAQRLLGPSDGNEEQVSQLSPQDSGGAPTSQATAGNHGTLDQDQDTPMLGEVACGSDQAAAVQREDDAAMRHINTRRHGGALPE